MNPRDYWLKKHTKYLIEDWISKPTIFATQVIKYFPQSGNLLELGCGQGQDSKYFASLGYKIIATDFSQFALDQIKNPHVETKILDLNNKLPFGKESFDIVYCHLGMGYFTDKRTKEIFEEIYEILAPGGVFLGLFNSTDDPETKTGDILEKDYYFVGGISKRFFSLESVKKYIKNFDIQLLDNKGTTHKDNVKGVKNLIRFVGKKLRKY